MNHICNLYLRIECILLKFHWGMKALTEVHFQWSAIALHVENVVRSTLSYPNETLHWKCTSVNAFIPQWNFKRMHSILIIIFKSHQNVIWLNFSLWILFVLDYLLLEITTPLIVYIWRRRGGTCKFGFEFHWDVKHHFYNHVTTS
jgi:hypothetical protein